MSGKLESICFLLAVLLILGSITTPIGLLFWAVTRWKEVDCDQPLLMWLEGLFASLLCFLILKCAHQCCGGSDRGHHSALNDENDASGRGKLLQCCMGCLGCFHLVWIIIGTVWYAESQDCNDDFKNFSLGAVLYAWIGGIVTVCLLALLIWLGGIILQAGNRISHSAGPRTRPLGLKRGLTKEIIKQGWYGHPKPSSTKVSPAADMLPPGSQDCNGQEAVGA